MKIRMNNTARAATLVCRYVVAGVLVVGGIAGVGHYSSDIQARPLYQENELAKTLWLLGEWQHKTPRGILYEFWKRENDSTLAGKSYFLKDKDTVVLETVRIKHSHGNLWYIPTVKNQNQGRAVPFKLTKREGATLVFENPEHDFPQRIMYSQLSADSLLAEISGMVNGSLKRQQFPMHRSR